MDGAAKKGKEKKTLILDPNRRAMYKMGRTLVRLMDRAG